VDEDTRFHQAAQRYAEEHDVDYIIALYAVIHADNQADVDLEGLDEDGRLDQAAQQYTKEHDVDYLTALKAVIRAGMRRRKELL
jgi:hypothetical protein